MTELKPCPFCGGKADIDCGNGICRRYYVYCTKCGTRHPNTLTRKKAIEEWNRRATMAEYCPNCGAQMDERVEE